MDIWILNPAVLIDINSFEDLRPCSEKSVTNNINILARIIIFFTFVIFVFKRNNAVLFEGAKFLAFLAIISLIIPIKAEGYSDSVGGYADGNANRVGEQPFASRRFSVHPNSARYGVSSSLA